MDPKQQKDVIAERDQTTDDIRLSAPMSDRVQRS